MLRAIVLIVGAVLIIGALMRKDARLTVPIILIAGIATFLNMN